MYYRATLLRFSLGLKVWHACTRWRCTATRPYGMRSVPLAP